MYLVQFESSQNKNKTDLKVFWTVRMYIKKKDPLCVQCLSLYYLTTKLKIYQSIQIYHTVYAHIHRHTHIQTPSQRERAIHAHKQSKAKVSAKWNTESPIKKNLLFFRVYVCVWEMRNCQKSMFFLPLAVCVLRLYGEMVSH